MFHNYLNSLPHAITLISALCLTAFVSHSLTKLQLAFLQCQTTRNYEMMHAPGLSKIMILDEIASLTCLWELLPVCPRCVPLHSLAHQAPCPPRPYQT